MKAIILAAGRGSRMKNLTDERPKCLVDLRGRPLLEWQLEAIRAAGIHEIAIVTGYKRELLAKPGLHEFHNPKWATTNMVSSLACAEPWLNSDECIISYSDIFYSAEAVLSLIRQKASLAITYDPNWLTLWKKRFGDPLLDAETFRINQANELVEIGGKPKNIEEIEGQYMGLLKITPPGWREITKIRDKLQPDQADKMHMTGTLQRVVDAGRVAISAVPYIGEWGEVDSVDDLKKYND